MTLKKVVNYEVNFAIHESISQDWNQFLASAVNTSVWVDIGDKLRQRIDSSIGDSIFLPTMHLLYTSWTNEKQN